MGENEKTGEEIPAGSSKNGRVGTGGDPILRRD
jgi:hypothetical protein